MNADLIYYRRRAVEEAAAAAAAVDARACSVHLKLARAYRERCTVIETEQGTNSLRSLVPAA